MEKYHYWINNSNAQVHTYFCTARQALVLCWRFVLYKCFIIIIIISIIIHCEPGYQLLGVLQDKLLGPEQQLESFSKWEGLD